LVGSGGGAQVAWKDTKLDLAVSQSLTLTVSQSLTQSRTTCRIHALTHSLTALSHSAGCCCFFAATSHTLYLQSGLYCSTLPHILGINNDETLVIDYTEDGFTRGNAESNRGGCLYTQKSSDGWSLKHPLLGTRHTSTKCDTRHARIPLLLINAMPVCLLAVSACMAKRLPEVVNGVD